MSFNIITDGEKCGDCGSEWDYSQLDIVGGFGLCPDCGMVVTEPKEKIENEDIQNGSTR